MKWPWQKKEKEPPSKLRKPEDVEVGHFPVHPSLSFWTAEQAMAAIELHKRAMFRTSALLAIEIWGDNRVDDGLRKRALALSTLPMEIQEAPGGAQQADLLRGRGCSSCKWVGCPLCGSQWSRMFPLHSMVQLQGFRILMGFSLGTLGGLQDWESRDGVLYPRLRPWHPALVI